MAVIHDFIVVGSGMTGAHAAQTLVEAGCKVLMLDVGVHDNPYAGVIPMKDFMTLRTGDESQHRYFLGEHFEGIPWGEVKHALTPPRQYLIRDIEKWLPFQSSTFNRMESLCYGGLGSGWGAGCAAYPDAELREIGLNPEECRQAYKVIARRVGVAAQVDDVTPYCASGLKNCSLPPLKMDTSISKLYDAYLRKRSRLNAKGIYMGKTPMAVLTRQLNGRKALPYTDMEFWADHNHAVYRPWMTVDRLKSNPNFSYKNRCMVMSFREKNDRVVVQTWRTDRNRTEQFYCKKLVLASGVLSTARTILRSFACKTRLPILTNAYALVPCIHLRMLGKTLDRKKTSLGQLEMFYDAKRDFRDVSMVTFYTYRSLLLFKLVKEVPLNMADAFRLMRALASSLVIAAINHPDRPSEEKYLQLVKDPKSATGDRLQVVYRLKDSEKKRHVWVEKQLLRAFRSLGCMPLVKQNLQAGSVVHYAGTLPFDDPALPFTLTKNGRLNNTKHVYVADGSGFKYLPANGLTFTLMANAHLVATRLANGVTHD